ncbi:hypothetical protein HHI36_014712 [Cryptolaemus montrouzieri]|uniref:Globin domain-containing protein n=1 Tax=Cryptolaemus montrouzieri TaxID=559131 RepID=A0ABD2N3J9_9CUCU
MGIIFSFLGWTVSDGNPDAITGLTETENRLIETSWAKIMESPLENGMAIMQSFLEKYPNYMKLFPFKHVPMDELKDNSRFKVHCTTVMYHISQLVNNLRDGKLLIAILDKLAANHKKLQVPPQGYDDIKGVILDILEAKVSLTAIQAWRKLLDLAMTHVRDQL